MNLRRRDHREMQMSEYLKRPASADRRSTCSVRVLRLYWEAMMATVSQSENVEQGKDDDNEQPGSPGVLWPNQLAGKTLHKKRGAMDLYC